MTEKKRHFFIVLLFASLFCLGLETSPAHASEEFDEILKNKVNKAFRDQQSALVGVSAAIIVHGEKINGKEIWTYSTGENYSSKINPWGTPLKPERRMAPGSQTKSYVATLVLYLIEEGYLDLDDTIGSILADEQLPDDQYISRDITVKELLSHTSGLSRVPVAEKNGLICQYLNPFVSIRSPVDRVRNYRIPAEPKAYSYSNMNYTILGLMIEEITGRRLSVLLKERFFDPLQLDRTFLADEHLWEMNIYDMARGYRVDGSGSIVSPSLLMFSNIFPAKVGWAAGGIVTTVEEMARWADMLYHQFESGETALLSEDSYNLMMRRVGGSDYGLGVRHNKIMSRTYPLPDHVGHGGEGAIYSGMMVYFSGDNIEDYSKLHNLGMEKLDGVTVVVFFNTNSDSIDMARYVWTIFQGIVEYKSRWQ